ncbi:MAG: type II toxin-antitoxin system RelB/DinJ family antitoxin [Peptococcaceae bacterium]|jgi:DNA-damage-inducible protein J|nr:type II toxin-antitoxin system RelB/DinJ family antitoxin [Peptococcaceae bacterium]
MANTKSNVNVKIDADVKELAIRFLGRMGLDQTTAIDMFYRQIIAERRLPFQPTLIPTLEERLASAVLKKNIPTITLDADESGRAVIDKERYPEIYDWLVNG